MQHTLVPIALTPASPPEQLVLASVLPPDWITPARIIFWEELQAAAILMQIRKSPLTIRPSQQNAAPDPSPELTSKVFNIFYPEDTLVFFEENPYLLEYCDDSHAYITSQGRSRKEPIAKLKPAMNSTDRFLVLDQKDEWKRHALAIIHINNEGMRVGRWKEFDQAALTEKDLDLASDGALARIIPITDNKQLTRLNKIAKPEKTSATLPRTSGKKKRSVVSGKCYKLIS